ncbi:hypothetical protein GYMLUDRAFT_65000 [Collybiopsis luxurians FD-317 M1]|uniref:Amidase domain-containing protein n=1 Tax=Collybiopsis luxurians FD-317 M1 TaxID=944289 RepID=A0A0D0ALN6_9AGAR|nr:hypothetical protein GYMLUDRAFT_65000 [Collybiopsis luxurians FD-317 M1]
MTRTIEDSAIVLSIIVGPDPNDNYTLAQPLPVPDYERALAKDALRGKRIAMLRRTMFTETSPIQAHPFIFEVFDQAVKIIESLGATTVQANMSAIDEILTSRDELIVASIDMKIQVNDDFASLLENPSRVRNMADLIKFNKDNAELEMPEEQDQSGLIEAEATRGPNLTYYEALRRYKEIAADGSVNAGLREFQAGAILMPGFGTTTASGNRSITSELTFSDNGLALAGYPIVTGFFPDNTIASRWPGKTSGSLYPAPGAPIGLSFLGTLFSELELIGFAYAYEQATKAHKGAAQAKGFQGCNTGYSADNRCNITSSSKINVGSRCMYYVDS